MRTLISKTILCLLVGVPTFGGHLEDLNQVFAENIQLLNWSKPEDQSFSRATLIADKLIIEDDRVTDFGLSFQFSRVQSGKSADASLKVQYENKYDKNPASFPVLKFTASLPSHLLAILFQPMISGSEPGKKDPPMENTKLANFIMMFASSLADFYLSGPAVPKIQQKSSIEQDEQGQFAGASGAMIANLGSAKLGPEALANLLFRDAKFAFKMDDRKTELELTVIMNPLRPSFQKDGQGLKELIGYFIDRDAYSLEELTGRVNQAKIAADQYFGAPTP